MRVMLSLLTALILAVSAGAQPPVRGVPSSGPAFGFGFGNVVFPGGAPASLFRGFSITDPGFAANLGGIVSGFRPYTGGVAGAAPHRGLRGPAIVGIPYPVYLGTFGYYDGSVGPGSGVVIVPTAQPAPTVVINQTFGASPNTDSQAARSSDSSSVQIYQAPSAPVYGTSSQTATIYLVAFTDGTIKPAIAYWIDGDSLAYVTPQGNLNRASLALIDKEYTDRLNKDNGSPVRLSTKN